MKSMMCNSPRETKMKKRTNRRERKGKAVGNQMKKAKKIRVVKTKNNRKAINNRRNNSRNKIHPFLWQNQAKIRVFLNLKRAIQ